MHSFLRVAALAGMVTMFVSSCDENIVSADFIPSSIVDIEININTPQFFSLQNVRGTAFIPNEGDRGIILYRKSESQILAIEANCSYKPNEKCANVNVDPTGLFLIDDCCQSSFSFEGSPTSGPATGRLFLYNTSLNASFLRINN